MLHVLKRSVVFLVAILMTGAPRAHAETTEGSSPQEGIEVSMAETPPSEEAAGDAGEDSADRMRVSMQFQDANLKDVLKTFSEQTGVNVIAGADVGDQAVTLYLEDVTVMDALDQILRAGNLTYERPPGSEIYIVRPRGAETPATLTRVYRLRYGRVSRSTLARAAAVFSGTTPFEVSRASVGTSDISLGGTGGGGGGSAGGSEEANVGVDLVIEKLLTPAGSVIVDGRTNSLIVTDVVENFPRIEAALAALDVRTPQVMVDAEVIETTLSKVKDLGFEWGDSEGTIFQLTPAKRETRFPFSQWFGNQGRESVADPKITVGTVDTAKAVLVLKALETDSDTKILARPKVLTLDNESAIIRLTSDEAIGFETASQATTATQTAEPERTTTGVLLVVTPQVNDDGYITMLVEPSVTKTVKSQITPPTGQSQPRDPKTRSSRTLVRVRSGDTLVVGGLIDRSEEGALRQVPILSGIPFVGEAFKNTDVKNSASELIVFITPRLLDEPGEGRVASSGTSLSGLREQEPTGRRQDTMEQTLNALERQHPL